MKTSVFSNFALTALCLLGVQVNLQAQSAFIPPLEVLRKITQIEAIGVDKVAVTKGSSETKVVLGFETYGCSQKFENFGYTYKLNNDGTVTISYVAFISEPTVAPEIDCTVIVPHQEDAVIPGIFTKGKIEIQSAQATSYDGAGKSFNIPETTIKLSAMDNIKVTKVTPLCPATKTCVQNGTQVKLVGMLPGCVDTVGAFAYVSEQEGDEISLKFYGLQYQDGKKVMCVAPSYAQFTLTLTNQYASSISKVKVELFK